jgi:predicted MPP superfamily phosphohydrolase
MWFAIFIVTIVISIVGAVYLINAVSRFRAFTRFDRKWQQKLNAASVVILCFAGFAAFMGMVNAITILVYVIFFFLISGFIVRIVDKVHGTKNSSVSTGRSKVYLQGWLAIAVSIVYLSGAYYMCHNVWRTDYNLKTDKDIQDLHIALIADSHLGTTFDGEGFAEQLKKIEASDPDMLLIAGDFVDNDSMRTDMVRACEALGTLDLRYGVFFVYGNHDKHTFGGRDFTAQDLEDELIKNNVRVLEDEIVTIDNICIAGRKDYITEPRLDIDDLLQDVSDDKYIIVLDHEPTDYENESASASDLVVSGHTHGGQLLAIKYIGELTGVNDRTYGYERIGHTDFIVTSGISDWALDFKTGTRSEYVMINVN